MIRVRYGKIEVGTLTGEAGVHVGNNFVGGRMRHEKTSEAVGRLVGTKNVVSESRLVVMDDDVVDGGRIQSTELSPRKL